VKGPHVTAVVAQARRRTLPETAQAHHSGTVRSPA
jgi:hypothetical protein